MHKHVRATFTRDKAITLLSVEPFNGTGGHSDAPFCNAGSEDLPCTCVAGMTLVLFVTGVDKKRNYAQQIAIMQVLHRNLGNTD